MFRYMEGYNFVCTLHILNVIRLVGRVTRNGIYLVTHKTLFGGKKTQLKIPRGEVNTRCCSL